MARESFLVCLKTLACARYCYLSRFIMAEHNDHGFMATKENAAPLKQATIDRAMAMNEKSVSLPRDLNKTRARRAARLESHLPVGRQSGRRARTAPDRRRRRT